MDMKRFTNQQLQAKINELKSLKSSTQAVKTLLNQLINEQVRRQQQAYNQGPKLALDYPEPSASTIQTGVNTMPGNNKNNGNNGDIKHMEQQAIMTGNNVQRLQQQYDQLIKKFNNLQAQSSGNLVPNESAKTLGMNLMNALGPAYMPGNVGDLNKVVWPFWFTDTNVAVNGTIVRPNQEVSAQVAITQEAAFILVSYTKAVFLEGEDQGGFNGQFTYIDPAQPDGSGKSTGLFMSIRDSVSTRSFFNLPMSINQVGYWQKPTQLPRPVLFLPNSLIEMSYQNNTQTNSYKVFTTFFGYRLRLEHAPEILSLVTG